MTKKTMVETNEVVVKQLKDIRSQLSKLIKDRQLQKLGTTLAIYNGPARPYLCRPIYSRHDVAKNDVLNALTEIHQWMGHVVKVLELNR